MLLGLWERWGEICGRTAGTRSAVVEAWCPHRARHGPARDICSWPGLPPRQPHVARSIPLMLQELGPCQGWGCPSPSWPRGLSGALRKWSDPTSLLTSAPNQWLTWIWGAWGCRGAASGQGEVPSIQLLSFPFPPPCCSAPRYPAICTVPSILLDRPLQKGWSWVGGSQHSAVGLPPQEQSLGFPPHFVVLAGRREPGCSAPVLAGGHALLSLPPQRWRAELLCRCGESPSSPGLRLGKREERLIWRSLEGR